jgi:hypothetical protein
VFDLGHEEEEVCEEFSQAGGQQFVMAEIRSDEGSGATHG